MPTIKHFGKLVTDDIPRNIQKDGQIPRLRKIGDAEFEVALRSKILEEAFEVKSAQTREDVLKEAAQLTAWLGKLLYVYNISPQQLTAEIRRFKNTRGFEKNYFLQSIEIPDGQQ